MSTVRIVGRYAVSGEVWLDEAASLSLRELRQRASAITKLPQSDVALLVGHQKLDGIEADEKWEALLGGTVEVSLVKLGGDCEDCEDELVDFCLRPCRIVRALTLHLALLFALALLLPLIEQVKYRSVLSAAESELPGTTESDFPFSSSLARRPRTSK